MGIGLCTLQMRSRPDCKAVVDHAASEGTAVERYEVIDRSKPIDFYEAYIVDGVPYSCVFFETWHIVLSEGIRHVTFHVLYGVADEVLRVQLHESMALHVAGRLEGTSSAAWDASRAETKRLLELAAEHGQRVVPQTEVRWPESGFFVTMVCSALGPWEGINHFMTILCELYGPATDDVPDLQEWIGDETRARVARSES